MQDGRIITYRDDGSLLEEVTYEQGVRHGPYKDYWSNGNLACEGEYDHGVQEGEWRFYSPNGTLRDVIRFRGGREVVKRNSRRRDSDSPGSDFHADFEDTN